MLIKLDKLVPKYNLKIDGIVHIGAHMCEELGAYLKYNVPKNKILWIEGNEDLVLKNKKIDSNLFIIHGLISDKDNEEIELKISNNGQSSSIFDFGTHSTHYKNIKYIDSKKYKTKRMDTIYNNLSLEPTFANFLNIDIQGAELLALKSFGDILSHFDYIYLEVNKDEVYKGCALITEIDEYLKGYGFEKKEVKWTKAGWGDAFYMKC